jgi:hypothetical protein
VRLFEFILKLRIKTWAIIVSKSRNKKYFPKIYKSFWYSSLIKSDHTQNIINYYNARPNLGAGIGHQMANWIAGYWFAKQFGLKYAHSPFSTPAWDSFLGFGENEITVDELIKSGFKRIRLPLFDEFNVSELELQKKIIKSYYNRKVIFVAEQDQGYKDQFGIMKDLKEKFFNSKSRINDKLLFDPKFLNIAIHVRRGDIAIGKEANPNLIMRWQGNEYFVNVLGNVLNSIKTDKSIAIYLFSQGKGEDFTEFEQFEKLQYCLDVNPMDSFLHMVCADILITSKSSFSYKPALLNKGIKICPKDFWHGYPETDDWILVDESGALLSNILL